MRIAFHCSYTPTLCWSRRFLDEGSEVLVYLKGDVTNRSGEGIVPVTHSQEQWLAWGAMDPNTIYFFDMSKSGELADRLRKAGRLVVNGGTFQDRLEFDREWGEEFAKKQGIQAPPTLTFNSISEVINFLRTNPKQKFGDGGWAWKASKDLGCDTTLVGKDSQQVIDHVEHIRRRFSDSVKCILQEKIDGVAVSTARWWNGITWVGPYQGTIENKKFMDGNLGPATGCSFDVVWFYWDDVPYVAECLKWEQLGDAFRKQNAGPGLYDINAILNKQGAWFLEWTPRLGVDSEITSQRGISNLSQFIENLVNGKDVEKFFNRKLAYFDVALSVPPYPMQDCQKGYKSPAPGIPIRGIDGLWDKNFVMGGMYHDKESGFCVGEPTGNLGYAVASGNSMKKVYEKLYTWVKENLIIPDLQYRTDAAKVLQDDVDKMKSFGFDTCPALRR